MNSVSNEQPELNEVKERDKAEYKKTLAYYIEQIKNPAEDPSPDETLGALCNVKAKLDALQGGKRKSRRNKKSKKSKKSKSKSKNRRKSSRRSRR